MKYKMVGGNGGEHTNGGPILYDSKKYLESTYTLHSLNISHIWSSCW